MLSLKTALANVANWIKGVDDYVVETGTNSGWYYRKWKSNKLEMWYSGQRTSSSNSWNGGYGISFNITAPYATTNGMAFFMAKAGSGYGMPAHCSHWSTSTKEISIITWGSQSDTVTYNVYVIGTWSG